MDNQNSTKTVSGYGIQLNGFIPIPKGNLRLQAQLTSLMADVEEGERPFSDLFDLIQDRDMRVQAVNRRFPADEAEKMIAIAEGKQEEAAEEEAE